MSRYKEIFKYLRQCPRLKKMWSIGAIENEGVSVIIPQGASPAVQYQEKMDVTGDYSCEIIPYPSVYEDYQINCYQFYDSNDNTTPEKNVNVLALDEVQEVCDWIAEQNDKGNLPRISGKQVVSIECNPFVPQVRGVNTQENLIAYFITVRIRYVNTIKRKSIEYGATD